MTEIVKIKWQGRILAIQCRAWVWRYKTDNRTHHLLGYNIWLKNDKEKFIVAISETQYQKAQFRIGDVVKGTAWPCTKKSKHDIADYYRAGSLKIITKAPDTPECTGPPFTNILPELHEYDNLGARMLDSKKWSKECFTCMWANKSAVEIEYDFGKTKRYRKETFCYGPFDCIHYDMGKPRPVQYKGDCGDSVLDDGCLDDCCTSWRGIKRKPDYPHLSLEDL